MLTSGAGGGGAGRGGERLVNVRGIREVLGPNGYFLLAETRKIERWEMEGPFSWVSLDYLMLCEGP